MKVKSVAQTEFTGVLDEAWPNDPRLRIGTPANGKITDPIDWTFSGILDGNLKYGNFYWRTMADQTCSPANRKTLYSSFLTREVMPKDWGS